MNRYKSFLLLLDSSSQHTTCVSFTRNDRTDPWSATCHNNCNYSTHCSAGSDTKQVYHSVQINVLLIYFVVYQELVKERGKAGIITTCTYIIHVRASYMCIMKIVLCIQFYSTKEDEHVYQTLQVSVSGQCEQHKYSIYSIYVYVCVCEQKWFCNLMGICSM